MNTIFPKSNLRLMSPLERLNEIEATLTEGAHFENTLLKWNAPVRVRTVYGIYSSNLNNQNLNPNTDILLCRVRFIKIKNYLKIETFVLSR
jgi:hypothetical protein